MYAKLSTLLLALSLTGCISSGTHFDANQISALQPGVTTESEAIQLLGQPEATESNGNTQILTWQYTADVMGFSHSERTLSVSFDAQNKMLRIVKQAETSVGL